MATTFKVPSSPNKSIFSIDTFLGVDLTNSGTNIDEHYSPNALNMTRYVPSKVRKRMGYHDEVIFSDGTDINRCIGFSDEWTTFEFGNSNEITILVLPEEVERYCMNIHYACDDALRIYYYDENGSYSFNEFTTARDDVHIKGKYNKNVKRIVAKSFGATYVKVKSPMIMHKVTDLNAFKNLDHYIYPPEDIGVKFILTEVTSPVYGYHQLLTQKKTGNFVKNVNRVLGTSDSSQTYTLGLDGTVFQLSETLPKGQNVQVSFRYKSTGNFYLNIDGVEKPIPSATTLTEYYTDILCTGIYSNQVKFWASSSTTLEIDSLSITYERDSNYDWEKAPEDNGGVFNCSDVYTLESSEHRTQSSISTLLAPSGTTYTAQTQVQLTSECIVGLTVIEFDLSANIDLPLSKLEVKVVLGVANDPQTELLQSAIAKVFTTYPVKNHVAIVINTEDSGNNYFAKSIAFAFTFSSYTAKTGTLLIENLTVRGASFKTDYATSAKYNLYHVGTNLFLNKEGSEVFTNVYSNMNAQRSMSWQFIAHELSDNDSDVYNQLDYENLYIVDGKKFLYFDQMAETVQEVYGTGYIPLVTIAKDPTGGGQSYEDLNLLNPAFRENFMITASKGSATAFQLSFTNLDATKVRAWVLENSEYVRKYEDTDFMVDRQNGTISFLSPVRSGSDADPTVIILAYKTFTENLNKINNCSFGALFGVNGASDRLFLAGNDNYRNQDWWSAQYDPTYFPERSYSQLGLNTSAIKGYAIVNNYLAAFKDENEPSQSVIIREGDLIENEAAFKIINAIQGNGAISPFTFGYLQTEPLFLTKSGIFAITSQDISGDKYGQNRSFYLNGKLTEESNLENAYAIIYNDMYLLSVNNKMYVLDGLQPIRTDKSEPYATRQYVAFYWDNIPANCLWVENDTLCFGTTFGHVCKFATDVDALESYNDNGNPISCCWETPDLDGKLFYKNKSFRYLAIRMMSALKTSAKLWSEARGAWSFIKEDSTSGIFFDFENVDFEAFSFSTDRSDKVAHSKIRVKKVDKARFKIENSNLNEPFGLMDLALEYVESGNYKG